MKIDFAIRISDIILRRFTRNMPNGVYESNQAELQEAIQITVNNLLEDPPLDIDWQNLTGITINIQLSTQHD